MYKGNRKRGAGAALALLFTVLLAGCGADTTPQKSTGIEAVLDKVMPACYGGVIVFDDAYMLFRNPPSGFEKVWDLLVWTGDRNAWQGTTTGEDGWYLSAHREGSHWVVDDTTLDPAKTSPTEMVVVLQRSMADADETDRAKAKAAQQAVADSKTQADKARASTTAWDAAERGALVFPASSSGN
jgi:hypothetical protein